MIFYVEQGVICTRTYGDIDERFYNSLESVYAEAINVITPVQRPRHDRILSSRRFSESCMDTRNIGWGFHDELSRLYREEYPAAA